jgi:prepilin-type N-terminal cleavage/methylation domain-containing protein
LEFRILKTKMKKLKKGERGFTLIEMLVVLVLIGIITGGITAGIMQVLTINSRASNHMIAVRQVQQAGKEVSKDTLQALNVTYTENPLFLLTLTWIDSDGAENAVNYTIEDNKLQRSQSIDGGSPNLRVIAQYIDPDQTSCNPVGVLPDDIALTFTVTATVGNGPYQAIETRIYEIEPRPS